MKRIIIFLFALTAALPAAAGNNLFFGETKNQFGFQAGQSVGKGGFWRLVPGNDWELESFQNYSVQYSQEFDFFRIPSRQNIHLGVFAAYKNDIKEAVDPVAGMSWDVPLLRYDGFYFGGGLGVYIKLTHSGRQDSLFMFGEKLFLGYRVSEKFSMELYTQHFDNAGLTPVNGGYTFFGLAALWNF
jgi:hypothetical protein